MVAIDNIRTAAVTQPFGGFSGIFRSAAEAVTHWNNARTARKSLAALSDRVLEDIGLTRGDIDEVALRNFR